MANSNKSNINLHAPLLSTRRFSTEPPISSPSNSTSTFSRRSSLPFYKPDVKSGPVRNPGVVPFVWEQKPGQPKFGTNSPCRVPVPKPPPAKLGSSVRTRKPITEFGSKEAIEPCFQRFNEEEELEIKKGEKFDKDSRVVQEVIESSSNTNKDDSKNKAKEEKEKEQKQKQKEIKEKEEKLQEEENQSEEDNFSDALETLSRTESFFMNCSISGLTELHLGPTNHTEPPGGNNLEARDFMMDRFLPAAQAVANGSPQYTFRKVPVQQKLGFVGTGMSPDQRRVPVPLPYQHQPKYENENENLEQEENEDEEEDDEEDLEDSRRFQMKGCGFLGSFCVKSSFMLMNPVPGMKRAVGTKRNGSPLIRSSINEVGMRNLGDSFDNYMHSWEPVYKHKQDQTKIHQNDKPNENNKKNSENSLLTYWSDSPNTRDGSSPLLHSVGSNGEDHSKAPSPPFQSSNGDNQVSNDNNAPSSPFHTSNGEDQVYKTPSPNGEESRSNRSSSIDPFLDAQDSNHSEVDKSHENENPKMNSSIERENEIPKISSSERKVGLNILPLELPKSPTESWLSKTLPSVNVKKQHVPSFLGMQSKKQGEERWRA